MKSRVVTLYDYTQAAVPDEMRRWRIDEAEIDHQIETLSHSHAVEMDADTVAPGDSVVCKGESAVPRWNKPVLLFYPGHELCEKGIEDALIGMNVGEGKTIAASEGELTLTVCRIVRRVPHPVDDDLVQLEKIEGVENLEQYRRWYREITEQRNRQDRINHIARMLLNETAAKTVYEIDEAEETEWATHLANLEYDSMVANGMDPTVPEDGVEFLTEEQAREKLVDQARPFFRNEFAYIALAVQLSGMDEATYFRTELERDGQRYYQKSAEELLEMAPESTWRSQVFHNGSEDLLRIYAEKLVEE